MKIIVSVAILVTLLTLAGSLTHQATQPTSLAELAYSLGVDQVRAAAKLDAFHVPGDWLTAAIPPDTAGRHQAIEHVRQSTLERFGQSPRTWPEEVLQAYHATYGLDRLLQERSAQTAQIHRILDPLSWPDMPRWLKGAMAFGACLILIVAFTYIVAASQDPSLGDDSQ